MSVSIPKLKVRPRKNPTVNLCATQLSAMLGCWAATSDLASTSACKQAAEDLFHCMRTTPMRGKQHRSSINYHLARLNKKTK
ncbi:hypothetical protein SERLA73DRAFT_185486 [Serpula lacrymans var. lacrymans S7.3]|uniref:37S ribosomal protein mrp10, mitochondrial n=2 Tax=Serpula lacrymans var. lacrymans TaxID=341189 RepID=F8Q5W5_SERL3|nr:uncharacterized protein SERLADRAFT_473997 [Serpula lacrymans var. lacrymans S7.9]EGN96003.1 hypothetical protein SERLA73DRAFT_185486 [Serpula lacrymans var. lacrymans S7.3]EGO21526.1 hypothetical protein SERLADRAFT_473997 [Serpula lacrymans var. lacrymans S7.9]